MKKKIFVICAGVIAVLALFSGCLEQTEETGVEAETDIGSTEIRVGDNPATDDFSHINITFSEIKLHKSGDNDSGWVNITLESKTVDLLNLHVNNITEQLGILDLDVGDYDKLWINVDSAVGVLNETGEIKNITVPSGWLKIQQLHLFNISKGNNTITVDIDLENSLHTYDGGTEYKLSPVISGIEHYCENELRFREREREKIQNMVENHSPAVEVVANGSRGKPITVDVDENITFDASETYDAEGDDITYSWDFDDGTNSTGEIVVHSYSDKGSYWVTLTVSDGVSESSVDIHVTVKEKGGHS